MYNLYLGLRKITLVFRFIHAVTDNPIQVWIPKLVLSNKKKQDIEVPSDQSENKRKRKTPPHP